MTGSDILSELSWLPRAPADFRDRLRNINKADIGSCLRFLASHALDFNQFIPFGTLG